MIIRIKEHLNENWKDWFDGVEISYEGDITVLTCEIKDQAYVHGILNQIRDLNLTLISVNPLIKPNKLRNHEKATT